MDSFQESLTSRQDAHLMCKYFSEESVYHTGFRWKHLPMSGDIFGCKDWGRELLALRGWKSGMLLNTPQCTPQERIMCPQISTNIFSKRSRPQQVVVHYCKQGVKGLKFRWLCEN